MHAHWRDPPRTAMLYLLVSFERIKQNSFLLVRSLLILKDHFTLQPTVVSGRTYYSERQFLFAWIGDVEAACLLCLKDFRCVILKHLNSIKAWALASLKTFVQNLLSWLHLLSSGFQSLCGKGIRLWFLLSSSFSRFFNPRSDYPFAFTYEWSCLFCFVLPGCYSNIGDVNSLAGIALRPPSKGFPLVKGSIYTSHLCSLLPEKSMVMLFESPIWKG